MQGGMTSCTEESLNVIVNKVPQDNVVCERDKQQWFVEDVCEVIISSIYDVNKFKIFKFFSSYFHIIWRFLLKL